MIADNAESNTPDSYSQLMNEVNVRKFPWYRTSETTNAADNEDEDSDRDTSGSGSGDTSLETFVAANENSEFDTSGMIETRATSFSNSKRIQEARWIYLPQGIQER